MNFSEKARRLRSLLDSDPLKAIEEAYQIEGNSNAQLLKASVLVDAGAELKNSEAIAKGVKIFESLHEQIPDNPEIKYNLGNGYHSLALSHKYNGLSWYQETHANRLRARHLFYSVVTNSSATAKIRTQASTNLANILSSSYRWVEAYDFYMDALQIDPCNGIASAGALKILKYALNNKIGNKKLLTDGINGLTTHIKNNVSTIANYGGVGVAEIISNELKYIKTKKPPHNYNPKNDFEYFVIKNNLALSPTIHSAHHNARRWDELNILSVSSSLTDGHHIPEVFPMFNVMKSDYILARRLYFDAINNYFNETGTYSDTLDYACYGVKTSALTLAQRAALDVLDKIAVAALSYLKIGGARSASFKNSWFKPRKSENDDKILLPKIIEEIKLGNTALLALVEIANDLSDAGGFLQPKQKARNSSTHRFTILHDICITSEFTLSQCLEHYMLDDFDHQTLATLKLARSSLFYFVQMILLREDRLSKQRDGLVGTLIVPSHEYIRGSDNK